MSLSHLTMCNYVTFAGHLPASPTAPGGDPHPPPPAAAAPSLDGEGALLRHFPLDALRVLKVQV